MKEESKKVEQPEMETERSFEVDEKKYFIVIPTADAIRQSDWRYSKAYNDALVKGISTSAEVMDILKRRGIIGEAYTERLTELEESLGQKVVEMELETDKDARLKLAVEVSTIRQDIFDWHQRVNAPLSHTCEQLAENARVDFLTSTVVLDEEKKAVWDSYEVYLEEDNRILAFEARMQVMLFMQGLSSDFLSNSPENAVIRELAAEEAEEVKAAEAKAEAALEGPPAPIKKVRKPRARRKTKATPAKSKE